MLVGWFAFCALGLLFACEGLNLYLNKKHSGYWFRR